jgi:hypothetical protein
MRVLGCLSIVKVCHLYISSNPFPFLSFRLVSVELSEFILPVIDVHKGIYAIFSRNLTTGQTERIVNSNPGGASRPEISRDGKTLAYVTRVRDKEALVLKQVNSVKH